jgi:Lytic polysaccharide mono-oxygenase, cellulose-degrading
MTTRRIRVPISVALSFGFCLAAGQAVAHIQLTSPTPRYKYSATGIKTGPCGATTGTKNTVGVPTHLTAGQSLTVMFTETVFHPGFFRISLNTTGAETFPAISPTPQTAVVAPVLADNILMHTIGSSGVMRMFTVTVPSTTCAKCTLQLTQFMSDNPTSGYYECADVVIDPVGGAGGSSGGGGRGSGGSTGGGGRGGRGGTSGTSGTSGSAGTGGSSSGSGGNTFGTGGTSIGTGGSATSGSGGASTGGSPGSGGATAATGGTNGGGTGGGNGTSSGGAMSPGTGGSTTGPAGNDEASPGCACSFPGRTGGNAFFGLASIAIALGLIRRRRGAGR